MKKLFFAGVVLVPLCLSCRKNDTEGGIPFMFAEAQPLKDNSLSVVPAKFRGKYLLGEDTLVIKENGVYFHYPSSFVYARTTLDSFPEEFTVRNGKYIFNDVPNQAYTAVARNDSVYLSSVKIDTFFRVSKYNNVKRMAGNLVLNKKDSLYWNVSMLSLNKDTLHWRRLSTANDIEKIQPLVKNISVRKDTSGVVLNPSRKEFRKLLAIKTDSDNSYVKIK